MSRPYFSPPALSAYELCDSGDGEKLERFGPLVLRRPDPQALWRKGLQSASWQQADLSFERESDRGGRWQPALGAHELARLKQPAWEVSILGAQLRLRPTPFKHVGLFPEQACNWELLPAVRQELAQAEARCLNLFAYTGAASILACKVGFRVTHVDASKQALDWTAENVQLSGLARDALRILLEDALSFVRREARRGARYEVIFIDPPHYGRGPKGEKWQLEEGLPLLMESVAQILAPRALVVLSTYAVGFSALSLANLLSDLGPGVCEQAELVLAESAARARLLPAGFCARYWRNLTPPPQP